MSDNCFHLFIQNNVSQMIHKHKQYFCAIGSISISKRFGFRDTHDVNGTVHRSDGPQRRVAEQPAACQRTAPRHTAVTVARVVGSNQTSGGAQAELLKLRC